MFIKLSYTANTRITVPLRVLTDIINTTGITSVATLQARFTSASYHSSLTANFDAANSTIIRTSSPSTTTAHVAFPTRFDYGSITFTIQQQAYDAPSSKIYTQLKSVSNNQALYFDIGTAITGGTMASSQASLTTDDMYTGSGGTSLILGGNNYGGNAYAAVSTTGWDNVRTFWAYITDKCFFWAVTGTTSYNSGWGSVYSDATKYNGVFFQTQYTRYDYHNTDSNGIYPVLYTNQRTSGMGYGNTSDISAVQNLLFATNTTTVPVRVHSMVSALPQVGTAWPILYNNQVHLTMGGRTTANFGANVAQTLGTATSTTTISHAGAYSSAASTRYPSANLSSSGFGMMPFGWEANYYGNHGGNASDQCGVYIFNGDYVPGDTFIYNGTQYMVWPMYAGYANRLGFAVPMV